MTGCGRWIMSRTAVAVSQFAVCHVMYDDWGMYAAFRASVLWWLAYCSWSVASKHLTLTCSCLAQSSMLPRIVDILQVSNQMLSQAAQLPVHAKPWKDFSCRSQQNINLDDAELTAAMKLLDKRGSGYIEFDEFVDWWVNKVCRP